MRLGISGLACALLLTPSSLPAGRGALEKPAIPPPPPPSAQEQRLFLQTVGLLAASQTYQAYLNVGFMADGKAAGVYQDKDLAEIMDSILNLLVAADKQIEAISKLDLSKPDRESLDQIRKLTALVRQQAVELKAFWKTGDKDRADNYEKLRQEAWQGISKLLGLDKPPSTSK